MSDFMKPYIYGKTDVPIAHTSEGDVILYDWNSPDVDDLAQQVGRKVTLGDIYGVLESVTWHKGYVGRYSADGYLDCTPWEFDTNKRRLAKTLRDLYGQTA
jgi:hypothetical protein